MAINGISLVIVSRAERGRDVDAISSRRSAERVERETERGHNETQAS